MSDPVGYMENCCECDPPERCRSRNIVAELPFNGVCPFPTWSWGDSSGTGDGSANFPAIYNDPRENERYLVHTEERQYDAEDGVSDPINIQTMTYRVRTYYTQHACAVGQTWKVEYEWEYFDGPKSRTEELDAEGNWQVTGDDLETAPHALVGDPRVAQVIDKEWTRHVEKLMATFTQTGSFLIQGPAYVPVAYTITETKTELYTAAACCQDAEDLLALVDLPVTGDIIKIWNPSTAAFEERAMDWGERLYLTYEGTPDVVQPPIGRARTSSSLPFAYTPTSGRFMYTSGSRYANASESFIELPENQKYCLDVTEAVFAVPTSVESPDDGTADTTGATYCSDGFDEWIRGTGLYDYGFQNFVAGETVCWDSTEDCCV